ncbi:S-adenosyl-L-methionine-dependent methyltransferase [Syncephalastrum racemosum]|uniref:rRNA adenine N(6)-methyltransferase n=1 Tax=Syncephalastrum racemosum TaxID=13706 RepID=A0A1X2HFT8_SYNRA|nr:S-adenosyl-L-methionine-dependent methyltransferase [Syncephalastrum racemosum]
MSSSSLPRLPSVREIIKLYGLSARSQLSQNFILDKNITDRIVRSSGLTQEAPLVLEVGPGPGLLTRSILDTGVRNVVAVEKDDRFLPTLSQLAQASGDRLKVIHGNIMEVAQDQILPNEVPSPEQVSHIMGNLPFNVASPLLVRWLHASAAREGLFGLGPVWLTLMFQKEVGLRLTAPASTEHRGRLSVMAQSLFKVRTIYKVPSSVFVPRPKVDAAVVQLTPNQSSLDTQVYATLENVLRYFFTKRRKTLGHILRRLGKEVPEASVVISQLEAFLDMQARPEDVTTEQFCQMAALFHTHQVAIP